MWKIPYLIALSLLVPVILAESYSAFAHILNLEPWMTAAFLHSLLACFVLGIQFRRGQKAPALAGIRKLEPYVPAVAIIAGAWLISMIVRFIEGTSGGTDTISQAQWLSILWIPAVEELVFRVGIGSAFRSLGGVFWGSYFSALTFSLVHSQPTFAALLAGKIGLPYGPLLLGLLCEFLYSHYGRILPIIAFHAACNATALIFELRAKVVLKWLGFLYQHL